MKIESVSHGPRTWCPHFAPALQLTTGMHSTDWLTGLLTYWLNGTFVYIVLPVFAYSCDFFVPFWCFTFWSSNFLLWIERERKFSSEAKKSDELNIFWTEQLCLTESFPLKITLQDNLSKLMQRVDVSISFQSNYSHFPLLYICSSVKTDLNLSLKEEEGWI